MIKNFLLPLKLYLSLLKAFGHFLTPKTYDTMVNTYFDLSIDLTEEYSVKDFLISRVLRTFCLRYVALHVQILFLLNSNK